MVSSTCSRSNHAPRMNLVLIVLSVSVVLGALSFLLP